MSHTVLIVDDDPAQRRLIESVVARAGHRALTAASADEAEAAIAREPAIAIVLLDLVMPGRSGFDFLEARRAGFAHVPVIVLTASGGLDQAVKAMQAGANDFLVKPAAPERIEVSIRNALALGTLAREVTALRKQKSGHLRFDDLIGRSPAMRMVAKMGERAAQSTIPILITGESGVGKELVARAIQGASDRAGKPFVTVNCGAIPDNLVESILFGHEKGAFTGANEKHAGKFVEASGGTLFLDEIGELKLDMQVKLLRALQEGEVDPVGARRPVKVDIRLVSATNKDLLKLVEAGQFREDLYYRLNVFPIEVPPLRAREGDVELLIRHFVSRFAAEERKDVRGLSDEAMGMLSAYAWPGNVRQLENAVFRAVVLADAPLLDIADFPQIAGFMGLKALPRALAPEPETAGEAPGAQAPAPMPGPRPQPEESPVPVVDAKGHVRPFERIEEDMIRFAIERYNGRMTEVARRLGIGRSTLYRKLRDYGIGEEAQAG